MVWRTMSEILGSFIKNYQTIFLFMYGLVFFTLGITILSYSRHYSRLTLAKSLPWLGGFGILASFFEWGYYFIPDQIEIIGQSYKPVLYLIHQIIAALMYTSLFQFGIELLGPYKEGRRWVRLVPTFVLFGWFIGPLIVGFSLLNNVDVWSDFANTCAKYFICIPGFTIAVIGLIHQQRQQIKPLKIPHIDTMIRISAGSLAAMGLISGVVTPKSIFFPSTIINYESFNRLFYVPSYVYLLIAGILLLYSMVRTLEIYNIETDMTIKDMEAAQVISNERERLARDIHDGVLQQVYASGLLAQSLKKHVPENQRPEVERLIVSIDQAISQLREYLPKARPDIESVDLIGAITPKIEEARRYVEIETKWNAQDIPSLSVEKTLHFSALLGEAISNAIRHSKTDKLVISLIYQDQRLILMVRDYGVGISPYANQGYGLKNMQDRAKLLGGTLSIESERSIGTLVRLDLQVESACEN
jgi:signal transduction histidine kinase